MDHIGSPQRLEPASLLRGRRCYNHSSAQRPGELQRENGDASRTLGQDRIPHHRARLGIEPAIDAVLPGEPQHALAIKARRVEVGVAPLLRPNFDQILN